MAETSRPTKRMKYDLRATFDVVVGQAPAERFTVYTNILTAWSRFLAATRKPEWLAGDASKPVDLSDEDPDVFQDYLNCVYLGSDVLQEHIVKFERQIFAFMNELYVCIRDQEQDEHLVAKFFEDFSGFKSVRFKDKTGSTPTFYLVFDTAESASRAKKLDLINGYEFSARTSDACKQTARSARRALANTGFEALIKLYLLADKLQDLATTNIVMDELINFVVKTGQIPKYAPINFAYNSTASSSPLRALFSDYWVYQMPTNAANHLKKNDFPKDFLQDVSIKLMLLRLGKATTEDCTRDKCSDKCLYHQHDDEHPSCGAQ